MLTAAQAVKQARDAQAQGVRIRDAQATKQRQQKHLDEAENANRHAAKLRGLAGECLPTLAKTVRLTEAEIVIYDGEIRLAGRQEKPLGTSKFLSPTTQTGSEPSGP